MGALLHYASTEMTDSICGVHCLKQTHGGDWEGYVVFGAPTYNWEKYLDQCSSVAKYGQCRKGGKMYVEAAEFAGLDVHHQ